jgi:two-component system, OmpR family, response regulator
MPAELYKETTTHTLIIDDEPDICYLLGNMLRQKAMEVQSVNSISGATDLLQRSKPQLIFLDNHLPDGYGMDFINYIKQQHADSKIIMITAHDTHSDRQQAFGEGVDYFISKPFSREVIYHAIDEVMHRNVGEV